MGAARLDCHRAVRIPMKAPAPSQGRACRPAQQITGDRRRTATQMVRGQPREALDGGVFSDVQSVLDPMGAGHPGSVPPL